MTATTLTTCNNAIEAHLIKGMLENNNISCILTNENFTTLMPHLNGIPFLGIQILVDSNDLKRAQELITESKNETSSVCPYCKSSNVGFGLGKKKYPKFVMLILSIFAGIPIGYIQNVYYCKDCKSEFI